MAHSDSNRPGSDGERESWSEEPGETPPFGAEPAEPEPVVPEREETLALGEETRLPWLEGDDDEEEESGYGAGQVVLFVLLGLLILGVIVGGIWWATRVQPDRDLVAQGGVIEAPDEPYKTRPDDPGGDVVEGTGDSSFAVAEGQTRTAQLGDESGAEAPVAKATDAEPTPAASPSPEASPAVSGPGVQVGAYTDRASAQAGWTRLSQQYGDLEGVEHRIVEGQADIGKVFRLQAVPGDLDAAKALCQRLQSAGLACYVKR